ncbi:MAG: alpha/beta hydrolase fold domain-containing protein [Halioglobus sp.]
MAQSKQLQEIIALVPADFADPAADFQAVRAMFAPFHGHPTGPDFTVAIKSCGGVRCGVYELQGTPVSGQTAFHCHGGAFVSTRLDEYHFYAEIIARQTGCRVVMPDYRLAPENPWPAAADDCFNAYRGLLEQGVCAASVVLLGESCGGSLALELLLRLRDSNLPLPACFISLTGWFDLSVSGAPVQGLDPFLTPEWVRNRGREYLAGKLELDDPRVSPANADLRGLPPLYLQIGQYDTVREGAITLAANALRAGVAVRVEGWPGMIQGWHGLVTAGVPEAIAAWSEIRHFIQATAANTGADDA